MNAPTLNETSVLETLREVVDPEIGCNLVDLGLIYSVAIQGPSVTVVMTLTTPGCPMHESLCQGVQNALLNRPDVDEAHVELVWEPPWQASMMTHAGRAALHTL